MMSDMSTSPMMPKLPAQDTTAFTLSRQLTASDHPSGNNEPRGSFGTRYCFFYGTLADSDTLSQVLKLPKSHTPPVMRRARVRGFEAKLWGPYPALVRRPLALVDGMAYEALSQAHFDRLAAYETNKYGQEPCMIELLDEDGSIKEQFEGVTFVWNGGQEELRDGIFDLKEWKKERQLRDLDLELEK